MREEEVRAALDAVPDISTWEGLDPMERERRAWTLDQIRRRIMEEGPRQAREAPERGRLFMPFAALEGYGKMIAGTEGDVADM